jgi:hypothetical protein
MGYDEEHGYRLGPQGDRADGLATAEAIAGAKLLKLQELALNGRMIGNLGLGVLGGAKGLPALRRLYLRENGLTMTGLKDFATSPLARGLRLLDVSFNSNLYHQRREVQALFPDAFVDFPAT